MTKEPSEKQLAARKAFAEAARARSAAKKAEVEKVEAPGKQCIFCGQYAKYTRFINLQTIAICEEHYYSTTVGQTAQRIREKTNVTVQTNEEA
jgi:hypothetical protein